jgi:alpha-ketoglutarate-dependent taurine dioxygenase
MSLCITPLEAPFGARVEGWDPGESLGTEDRAQLRHALVEHLVLVFRGHRVPSDEELVLLARGFGELAQAAELFGVASPHPDILPVTNEPDAEGNQKGVEGGGILPWHTDYSYLDRPAKESFLEAIEIPDAGGATSFCNMYRAWEVLPAERRERLRDLHGWHSTLAFLPAKTAEETPAERASTEEERKNPYLHDPGPQHAVWHPLAYPHPESKRTALYADAFLFEIEGLSREETIRVRSELIDAAARPDNVYTHEWERGDLVVFDAVGSLHRRDSFDLGQTRNMRQLSTLVPA